MYIYINSVTCEGIIFIIIINAQLSLAYENVTLFLYTDVIVCQSFMRYMSMFINI